MEQILGDYEVYIEKTRAVLADSTINERELSGADVLCYRVASNERYDELLDALRQYGDIIDESEVRGRLIAIIKLHQPIVTGGTDLWYVELPQPKPDSNEPEGFDHVQYVTRTDINDFYQRHSDVAFDTKAMQRLLHPQLKLKVGDVAVKFHDMNMGTVLRLEAGEASQ